MSSTSNNKSTFFSRIDAFPKTLDEFHIHTYQGGIISLLSFCCILFLLVSELNYSFSVETIDKMSVDGTRGREVEISFDIDFPRMPCCLISVTSEDLAQNVHLIDTNVLKTRMDLSGNIISDPESHAIGGALSHNESQVESLTDGKHDNCKTCYGANTTVSQCCNTCEDVKMAYHKKGWTLPSLHTISQCAREDFEKVVAGESDEGCKVSGSLKVSKVAGKLSFAPGQIFLHGYLHANDIVDFTFKNFDNSHVINYLVFGETFPNMKNPLDGRKKKEETYGTFQYYLKVVSTKFQYMSGEVMDTNQFSVTEHFKKVSPRGGRGFPEVTFSYEFDPIMFEISQERQGYLPFLTSVCAIVGGVFTIMGLVDSLIHERLTKASNSTPLSK